MAYARLSTRNRNGLSPNFRGLGFLGDNSTGVTAQDALTQAMQGYSSPDFQNESWLEAGYSYIPNANIPPGNFSPACAGIIESNPDLSLTQAAGQAGVAATSVLATAGVIGGSVAGIATFGIGAIVSILGAIFAHHAQMAKQEQQLGCAGINGSNNAFAAIAEGVANGSITAANAAQAVMQIPPQAKTYMQASIQNNPCNADCEAYVLILAIAIYWQAQYQQAAAQAAAVAQEQQTGIAETEGTGTPVITTSTPTIPASYVTETAVAPAAANPFSGIPTWAWLAAALGAAWMIL